MTAQASESLDQSGIDQQPIEASGLRAAGAEIEQAPTTAEDLLLLDEGGIERHSRGFQDRKRKIRRVERLERGGQIDRLKIQALNRVIGGEVTGIALQDARRHIGLVERRI